MRVLRSKISPAYDPPFKAPAMESDCLSDGGSINTAGYDPAPQRSFNSAASTSA